jgi:hypothetical protein
MQQEVHGMIAGRIVPADLLVKPKRQIGQGTDVEWPPEVG